MENMKLKPKYPLRLLLAGSGIAHQLLSVNAIRQDKGQTEKNYTSNTFFFFPTCGYHESKPG